MVRLARLVNIMAASIGSAKYGTTKWCLHPTCVLDSLDVFADVSALAAHMKKHQPRGPPPRRCGEWYTATAASAAPAAPVAPAALAEDHESSSGTAAVDGGARVPRQQVAAARCAGCGSNSTIAASTLSARHAPLVYGSSSSSGSGGSSGAARYQHPPPSQHRGCFECSVVVLRFVLTRARHRQWLPNKDLQSCRLVCTRWRFASLAGTPLPSKLGTRRVGELFSGPCLAMPLSFRLHMNDCISTLSNTNFLNPTLTIHMPYFNDATHIIYSTKVGSGPTGGQRHTSPLHTLLAASSLQRIGGLHEHQHHRRRLINLQWTRAVPAWSRRLL